MLFLQRLVLVIMVFISMAAFPFLCCVPGTSRADVEKKQHSLGGIFCLKLLKYLTLITVIFVPWVSQSWVLLGSFSLACVGIDFCLHSTKTLSEKKKNNNSHLSGWGEKAHFISVHHDSLSRKAGKSELLWPTLTTSQGSTATRLKCWPYLSIH